MRNKSLIRIYIEPKELTIIERAKYIVEKQKEIGVFFNKFDWFLFDKTPVDLRQEEKVTEFFLKRIKKNIKEFTTIKNVPDDYLDSIFSIDGFYATKKFDRDASFRYDIGTKDKNNNSSSLIISNFEFLGGLSEFIEFKRFLFELVDLFQPYSIEVSEFSFYRELMDLKSNEYWFGWMTYFSKDIKIPKETPSDIKIEELPNGGKLLITTEDLFTSENPDHVRKAKSLVELFRKNNIRA